MSFRKRRILEWTNDSDDEDSDALLKTVNIPHTEVHLGDSGSHSTCTSYLSTSVSPAKPVRISNPEAAKSQYYYEGYIDQHKVNSGLDEGHPPDLPHQESDYGDECDDDLDPAYMHHLDDLEPGPPKPKRRPRVCVLW